MLYLFIFLIISFFIFLKYLYFVYLLHFLDYIASFLAYFLVLIKKDDKIIEKNLNLVFNNKLTKKQKQTLKYTSFKLNSLNILYALHQRFIFNKSILNNFFDNNNLNQDFIYDMKKNGIILALGHYGIFYDFAGINYNLKGKIACVYKMDNKFFENIIYKSKNYKDRVLPIKYNNLGNLMRNKYDIIAIPCDHKNKSNKKIKFLNQITGFHYSVVDIHKITKRSLWCYFGKYNFDTKNSLFISTY